MNGYPSSYSGDDIYKKLKEDILTLILKPGQMISENEIANIYNVSRTPVKTAFLRLKGENFIDIIPQKGSFITRLDIKFIQDIIYMRSVLEMDVMNSILDRGPLDTEIAGLEKNIQLQHELISSDANTPTSFYELDNAFHYLLFRIAGRENIWDVIQNLQVYYMRFRILDTMTTSCYEALYLEHKGVLQSLRDGDRATLKARIFEHLHGNLRTLASKIEGELKDYFTDSRLSVNATVRGVL